MRLRDNRPGRVPLELEIVSQNELSTAINEWLREVAGQPELVI